MEGEGSLRGRLDQGIPFKYIHRTMQVRCNGIFSVLACDLPAHINGMCR